MERCDSITHVVILGSTGSIGQSALSVIEHDGGARLTAWGLSAHCRWQDAGRAGEGPSAAFRRGDRPDLAAGPGTGAARHRRRGAGGPDGMIRMVQDPETDRVLSAIVGAVGLEGTWAALEAGKIVALANKETLVVAGPLVMELARSRGGQILPVDSEHSAIFQALKAGKPREVRRVILTSSGGPFRGRSRQELVDVTPEHGPQAPHLADGPEDHDRLGHADEQGPRSDRSPLAVPARARPGRGCDPSGERGTFDGRVCRWQRHRTNLSSRHAIAHPVRADLSGPDSRRVASGWIWVDRFPCTSSRRTGRLFRVWTSGSR